MWEGVGDRTELQHIDPHSIGHNCVSFPFSWDAQPGPWGPASLWHVLIPASSLQLVWSPTDLISTWNCSIGDLRAHSAGCWLSQPHLLSNWLNFLCTQLYNCSTPTFFLWRHKLHSFNPSTVKVILCYFSTGCSCYLHGCISYFDSPAGS